jgi:hypothetical protein
MMVAAIRNGRIILTGFTSGRCHVPFDRERDTMTHFSVVAHPVRAPLGSGQSCIPPVIAPPYDWTNFSPL